MMEQTRAVHRECEFWTVPNEEDFPSLVDLRWLVKVGKMENTYQIVPGVTTTLVEDDIVTEASLRSRRAAGTRRARRAEAAQVAAVEEAQEYEYPDPSLDERPTMPYFI